MVAGQTAYEVGAPVNAAPISIAIDGLTKAFGGVVAVQDVTLHHDTGGVIGLIGPNGAGKTTLFNMISGAVIPTSGRIVLDGQDVTGRRPDQMNRAGVARTFQNLQIFHSLTVLENVLVARERHLGVGALRAMLRLGRRAAKEHHTLAMRLLEDVGVAEHADDPAASLPYGLQRRVEIARALASEPRILLLDEPLAGLSRAESSDLTALMRAVARTGVTVILVEHDVSAVLDVSDVVVVLNLGKVLAQGPPDLIRSDADVRAAYLGDSLHEAPEQETTRRAAP